jgi:hypothetical protein
LQHLLAQVDLWESPMQLLPSEDEDESQDTVVIVQRLFKGVGDQWVRHVSYEVFLERAVGDTENEN